MINRAFGELALLYNAPRAATVTAKTDMKLWRLDRVTFKEIVVSSTIRTRARREQFLRKVAVLVTMGDVEISAMADNAQEEYFPKGTHIIKQGEKGDAFYIGEHGLISVGTARAWLRS